MCAIAGLFNTRLPLDIRISCVRRMLGSMLHRGPDEIGYYFDDAVALGTARLSILDIKGGQQPIGDATGRYWICFNGEIYNYRELKQRLIARRRKFTTNSDTEVLLHAWIVWGTAALLAINGAFAFAIYDSNNNSIILARDRFGKRPLYYIQQDRGIVFGSEMKCLLAYKSFSFEFDAKQLASIFRVWAPFEDQNSLQGTKSSPAGLVLQADEKSTKVVRYAPLQLARPGADITEPEASALVYTRILESVRLRQSGDVEIGAYVSSSWIPPSSRCSLPEAETDRSRHFLSSSTIPSLMSLITRGWSPTIWAPTTRVFA